MVRAAILSLTSFALGQDIFLSPSVDGLNTTATTVKLNNGVVMPLVALGTWQYSSSTAEDAVTKAFAAGFTHVDTAKQYGNAVGVGKALKASGKKREDYFLTTKTYGCYKSSSDSCYDQTMSDFESHLADLGVDYVDMVLLHWPSVYSSKRPGRHSGSCSASVCSKNQGQWRAYEELYKQGKARAIGVSNYCASCLDCLLSNAEVVPAVNQIEWHVGMGSDPAGVASYTREKGILPQAYSPLASGSLPSDSSLAAIGESYSKSAAQVALKWLVDKGVPLATKSDSAKYLAQDIDMFSWELSEDHMADLDGKTQSSDKPSFACTA